MKIYLDVKVSDAATIAYALHELANQRREKILEGRGISTPAMVDALDALAEDVRRQATSNKPHD